MSNPSNTAEAILARVVPDPNGGCWLWSGAHNGRYAQASWHGERKQVHRLVYELLVGPIPEGFQIDHLCRVTLCVNPQHLEPVTPRENTMRGHAVTAINAAKTHCDHGHAYTEENTQRDRNGNRRCRTCTAHHSHMAYLKRSGQLTPSDTLAVEDSDTTEGEAPK